MTSLGIPVNGLAPVTPVAPVAPAVLVPSP